MIKVVDGDTFDVEGIGRIRLADVNTPEIDSKEGREAKEYVKGLCYLNQLLLKEGYAEARDYPNEFDPDDWVGPLEYVAIKPSPVRSPLSIPGALHLYSCLHFYSETCTFIREHC